MEDKENDNVKSAAAESCAEKKTGKKKVYHVPSRYMLSSGKKATPVTKSILTNPRSSTEKQQQQSFRKALFKGPSTPVRTVGTASSSLAIKKTQPSVFAGPVLAAVPCGGDGADSQEVLDRAAELDLLVGQNVASQFVFLKARASLRKLNEDAPRKLWALKELNTSLNEKMISLELQVHRLSFLRLFRKHLSMQKELQASLNDQLSCHTQQIVELRDSLDACLHYLPVQNVVVPQNLDKLIEEVQRLSSSLEYTLSKLLSSENYLRDLATEITNTKKMTQEQVENIYRLKEALQEAKDISGILTFHLMKQMQHAKTNSLKDLCFTEYD